MSGKHSHSHFDILSQVATGRLALALGLAAAFVVLEAAAGFFANSLALLTDAAHNVSDLIALALSWYAVRLAGWPTQPLIIPFIHPSITVKNRGKEGAAPSPFLTVKTRLFRPNRI
jgi:Co/Zn/Cd efflux system component